MTDDEKILAQRLRRKAARQGLILSKSRRRDPDATGYGRWRLTRMATGKVIAEGTLADMERRLTGR